MPHFTRQMVCVHLFSVIAIFLLVSVAGKSQPSIGIKGGALYVWNTSSIPIIAGDDQCGTFADGTSIGFFGGLTGDYALLGDALELTGSLFYAYRPARLVVQSSDNFEVLDPRTDSYVSLVREHVFESSLGYVSFEAGFRSRPLASIPIYVRATFDAGNPIVDATYTQTEEIVSPDGVLFPDAKQKHVTANGEFPGLGTSYGVNGGLGAVIALSENVELCPEVGYRYGLNSLSNDAEWKQCYAVGGIQVRYRFTEEKIREAEKPIIPEPQPEPEKPTKPEPETLPLPTLPLPVPATIASISTTPLEINETVVTQTFPLLPYIFFDSESTQLKSKYTSAEPIETFSELGLPKETLPIYYRMLDVVGKRMQENSDSKLTVTGTTDGIEKNALIAKGRAQSVVDYLTKRWGINASRFNIETAAAPSLASNEKHIEGAEENRRVELSSSNAKLLGPIVHSRFNEYVPTQPRHDFSVSVRNPNSASNWNMDVLHASKHIGEKSGAMAPPSVITFNLNQEMTNQLGPVVGTTDTLNAKLDITQNNGEHAVAETQFPLTKTISNFEVSRLSLIVFDYDRADISEANRSMMRGVIAAAVKDGSTATVIGSTDRLGEMDHNMELSTDRARAIEKFARSISPNLVIKDVRGVGPSTLQYDNNLPEGRFYCRTVTLTITTPLR